VLKDVVDLDAVRLSRALRRTRIICLVLGAAAVGVGLLTGYPPVGLGICVGLGLGAMNTRWADASVARLKDTVGSKAARRPIGMRTLGRLAISTVVVIGLCLLDTPMGFGVIGGLVLYEAAFLASMLGAVIGGGVPR
jgi:ATP synthase I chain